MKVKIGMTIAALLGVAAAVARAESPAAVRAYYFGNSLTGCTDPKDHEALAKPAGKEWKTWAFLGAGWQLWQHRHALQNAGVEMKRDGRGDLKIDPSQVQQSTGHNTKQFYTMTWDAIVLQPFSMGLVWKCNEMWGVKFDKETDVGDIECATDLIAIYLKLNPQGRVFVYQNWPSMKAGKIPPKDQLPEWAQTPGVRMAAAEFPLREEFDYEQVWLGGPYKPSPDPTRFWFQENARSKDYHVRLFAALKEKYPDLYKEGRLRTIPVGDIFLALHRQAKAGQFDGIKDIEEYYTDVQHTRGGLPRYTAAAAFYACLFDERPDKLDWAVYNDAARYGKDMSHDSLPILEITPERAKIANEAVWEVIERDPDARAGPK